MEAVDRPARFKALVEAEPFPAALKTVGADSVAAFHWQLEFPEVFFGAAGLRNDAGFDAVIGNPPYDVLSEKETGHDLSSLQPFVDAMRLYEPSVVGKNNLYKLFICRALSLLAANGRLGFITPMAVLGDEITREIRRALLQSGTFEMIEAFPQKDDVQRRVFREAKMATTVFIYRRSERAEDRESTFTLRVQPADRVELDSPSLSLSASQIPQYDPENLTIVSCSQADWDLATRITGTGRLSRLGRFARFFQGEVNETIQRAKGNLTTSARGGHLVTRGASLCLYAARPASQGDDLFLNVEGFLRRDGRRRAGVERERKADHYQHARIAIQESSPQNNFRRIIAAPVAQGEFCNHTINYCPEHHCTLPLPFLLALLNSKLADWYFRLGSTNAHVSHYQLANLPCPEFRDSSNQADEQMRRDAVTAMEAGIFAKVPEVLAPGMATPPFSRAVLKVMVDTAQRICAIEGNRGEISRSDRSALAPEAQPYQDLIDRLLYRMGGLTDAEAAALEQRLVTIL